MKRRIRLLGALAVWFGVELAKETLDDWMYRYAVRDSRRRRYAACKRS